ncbi:MAG: HEAT repeat domain-containing protein, partial [Candidatus Omnitrophica bacterium]|nr:HEAT repeat domain-containing protein [Candidatus Omnitrophota bacterium]
FENILCDPIPSALGVLNFLTASKKLEEGSKKAKKSKPIVFNARTPRGPRIVKEPSVKLSSILVLTEAETNALKSKGFSVDNILSTLNVPKEEGGQMNPITTINQQNYVTNLQDVRVAFLKILADMILGNIKSPEELKERFGELHRILLKGVDEKTWYVPPTFILERFPGEGQVSAEDEEIIKNDPAAFIRTKPHLKVVFDNIANLFTDDFLKATATSGFSIVPADANRMPSVEFYTKENKERFRLLFKNLTDFISLKDKDDPAAAIEKIKEFYVDEMGRVRDEAPTDKEKQFPYFFEYGNASLSFNMIQALLRLLGLNRISEGDLGEINKVDMPGRGQYADKFVAAVESANSSLLIEQSTGPVSSNQNIKKVVQERISRWLKNQLPLSSLENLKFITDTYLQTETYAEGSLKDNPSQYVVRFFDSEELAKKKAEEFAELTTEEFFKWSQPVLPRMMGMSPVSEQDILKYPQLKKGQWYFVIRQPSSVDKKWRLQEIREYFIWDEPIKIDQRVINDLWFMTRCSLVLGPNSRQYRAMSARDIISTAKTYGKLLGGGSSVREFVNDMDFVVIERLYPDYSVADRSNMTMQGVPLGSLFLIIDEYAKNVNIWAQSAKIIRKLGIDGNIKGIPELEKLLVVKNYPDPRIRVAAIEAAGKINRHRSIPLLIRGLRDPDRFVRRLSAQLLGNLEDARSVRPLIEALQDPDGEVFKNALESLIKIGDEDTVILLNIVRSSEPEERTLTIYDDHGTMVYYTEKARYTGTNTWGFKFAGTATEKNYRIQKIDDAIQELMKVREERRKQIKIDTSKIKDKRQVAWDPWLIENGLGEDILDAGGMVRDGFLGKKANDFDIGISIPLTDEERVQFLTLESQANERVYNYAMEKLKLLADKLGVDV